MLAYVNVSVKKYLFTWQQNSGLVNNKDIQRKIVSFRFDIMLNQIILARLAFQILL